MSGEIDLGGCHGTSITRAESIRREGFKKAQGRLGVGVYFWSDSPFAEYLARSWWKFEFSRNRYKGERAPQCAVIFARFNITEDDFLDLDNKKIKKGLAKLCIEKGLGFFSDDQETAALIIAFVTRLEKQLDHKFRVMESTVSTAPREFIEKYPLKVLGSPSCCIVFDESCIEIIN